MLRSLNIRNVVLIDRLSIEFREGLCALTGETGAGKSILLDSLGLALGARADSGLVRKGAEQAVVSAAFSLQDSHPVWAMLEEAGIPAEEGEVILRRVLSAEGKSRAFINDQAVSVALLRQVGETLVEIHGQFESQGLLNPSTHRAMLDEYMGLAHDVPALWENWRTEEDRLAALRRDAGKARADEAYLRHALEDLERWDAKVGEEAQLASLRERLMHREQVLEALSAAYGALSTEDDPLRKAYGVLSRVADKIGSEADALMEALDRAMAEAQDALGRIEALSVDLQEGEHDLESIDERLFGLKGLARKHGCAVDDLPGVREEIARQLGMIEHGDEALAAQEQAVAQARAVYIAGAEKLGAARRKSAGRLDKLVQAELPPLKLDKARFVTMIEDLPESDWGPGGAERVRFLVATNPGAAPGPIHKIASGGELSRFILALKVIIAQAGSIHSFIFDEVDTGIGGSTADAVGERLARLARERQVLVVTHAPQIAARAQAHWIVQKSGGKKVKTTIVPLETRAARCEEIARMLAGASITNEARAAADKLLENAA